MSRSVVSGFTCCSPKISHDIDADSAGPSGVPSKVNGTLLNLVHRCGKGRILAFADLVQGIPKFGFESHTRPASRRYDIAAHQTTSAHRNLLWQLDQVCRESMNNP
jgi:hypothetical protein